MRHNLLCIAAVLGSCSAGHGEKPSPVSQPKKQVLEETNCAVACAFLSARFFGSEAHLPDVVQTFPEPWRGPGVLVPAQEVSKALRKLGCEATVSKLDKEKGLADLTPGSILHLSISQGASAAKEHFVVYLGPRGEQVLLADPDHWGDQLTVQPDEVMRYWTGYVIVVREDHSLLRGLWFVSGVLGAVLIASLFFRKRGSNRSVPATAGKMTVLVLSLVAVVAVGGCRSRVDTRQKEIVDPPGLVDDLGVVPCATFAVDARVTPTISSTSPVKIMQVAQSCTCTVAEDNLLGSLFDPSAPREIRYRVELRTEGPFRAKVRLEFDDGEIYERDLRAFHEGRARASASTMTVPFQNNSSSARGDFSVERLRHHSSPPLAAKNPVVQAGWLRVSFEEASQTEVARPPMIGGDTGGVMDRLSWVWETTSVQSRPASQPITIEWTDPGIPPVTILFKPEFHGALFCPLEALVLKPGAGELLEANVPLRSDTLDLAGAIATVNGKRVEWKLVKTGSGCWTAKLIVERPLLTGREDRLVVTAGGGSLELPLKAIGLPVSSSKVSSDKGGGK